ncbi:MAG: apolipoprotein N-acyltransferase [Deltaproteobacteria bacterium]|nr:apolipoprotein N-acyltransferase [Deltaproteobacteria bacterium]
MRWLAGIVAASAILGLCSRIEGYSYLLDFFGLVPWLLVLDTTTTAGAAALCGLVMCAAFVVTIFAWFGFAIAVYSAGDAAAGLVVLLASAPLLQPQFIAFALVRHLAGRHYGPALRALAGASAWVATEWVFPKLLADNLAHGLYPSPVLRQVADLGGTAGITFALVVINECLAMAIARRGRGLRALAAPLATAAAIVALMTGYGVSRLSALASASGSEKPLRVGLIQSDIASYERLRREMGTYDVVRYVLDTHYAMSREAIDVNHVDALLWSETVYPTTFGRPKSDAGGDLDREIEDFVSRAGVPLVFGTYDRDDDGEYNAAVFLEPASAGEPSRFDIYRKTDLFLLTEYVPWWLEGPALRAALPWAGTWKPGNGARVLPLRLADGREIPVLPMICLDDVDAGLAITGARLGARVILVMSNDSWFTEHPAGANLHLVVSAFRSIETRLPQMRVTANGISAVIDRSGEIVAGAAMGDRAVVIGEASTNAPPATLMVAWGDWVGPACLVVLVVMLGVPAAARRAGLRSLGCDP